MRNTMLEWIEAADARLALQDARVEQVPAAGAAYAPGWFAAALGLIVCSALAACLKPAPSLIYAGLMQVMT